MLARLANDANIIAATSFWRVVLCWELHIVSEYLDKEIESGDGDDRLAELQASGA